MDGACSRTSLGSPVTSKSRAGPRLLSKAVLSQMPPLRPKGLLPFPQGWFELSVCHAKPPHATGLCSWHPHAPPKSVKIQFILIVSQIYFSPLAVCSHSLEASATLLCAPLLEAVLLFDCVFYLSPCRKFPQARHCLPVVVRFLTSPMEQVLCVESTWKSHQ